MRKKTPHPDQLAFDFECSSEDVESIGVTKITESDNCAIVVQQESAITDGELDDACSDDEDLWGDTNLIAEGFRERADHCRGPLRWLIPLSSAFCGYIILATLKIPVADPLKPIFDFPDVSDDPRTTGAFTFALMCTSLCAAISYAGYRYNLIQGQRYSRMGGWKNPPDPRYNRMEGWKNLPDPRYIVLLVRIGQWCSIIAFTLATILCLYVGFDDMLNFILSIKVYLMDFDSNWPVVIRQGQSA